MKPPNRRTFQMLPAFTPETKIHDVELEEVYEELRHLRRVNELLERIVKMKIADLEVTVNRLMDTAVRIHAAASMPPSIPADAQDDPAVERLNQRILDAINILEGNQPSVPQPAPEPAPAPLDPNAPAQPLVP